MTMLALAGEAKPRGPRKIGRPRLAPESVCVSLLLPTDLYDRADRKARARDLSFSEVVRAALRLYCR